MHDLKDAISSLPADPGVYQFYDRDKEIIYIGKAKNLRNRVSSYFNKSKHESYKTKILAKQITSIKHIVVENEMDALLLENNLIKKYQPKYNVLLKDDKTFPWICIKKEKFPRVFSTRKLVKDGSEYFGPYTSALMVRTLLELIRQLYQLRTCSYKLTPENIKKNKFKRCLEHHLGNCMAPCEGLQQEEDYEDSIVAIKKILKGNIQEVIQHLDKLMKELAANYNFEEAEVVRQKIILLNRFRSKSTIVNPKLDNIDVFSFVEKENRAAVNFLKIVKGAIVQSHTVELIPKLKETKEELLMFAIIDIREKVESGAKKIIVPFRPGDFEEEIKLIVPKMGDKKKLLDLSERNARQFFIQKEKLIEKKDFANRTRKTLEQLQKDLQIKVLPAHIECFDNSNIQGQHPVAACVVFENGKPSKKEYRHYNIKSVVGANDFASMEEIIYRRYKRRLEENRQLPHLIIIDGGKGQLSAAVNSLKKLDLYEKIPVIGIAKKLEEIYFPFDSVPLYLDKNSAALKLIQHLRNEAHRFGIKFHRDKRSGDMLKNQLEQIKGVGKATANKLLKEFGSVKTIEEKSISELENVIGKRLAKLVKDGLK